MSVSRLIGGATKTEEAAAPLTHEEEQEILANERAERIRFHREKVRNGPVNYGFTTAGQQRRALARAKKSHDRKTNKAYRRSFITNLRAVAVLRGQLQTIGALPFITEHKPTTQQRLRAGSWLVQRFAPRDDAGELLLGDDTVVEAVKAAKRTYLEAVGA